MTTPVSGEEAALAVKPGPMLPDAAPPCFPVIAPSTQPTLPQQPQGKRRNHVSVPKTGLLNRQVPQIKSVHLFEVHV